MSRLFRNCLDCAKEMDRELKVSGITVPVKHYQNVKLEGNDQLTKELIGVHFTISNPMKNRYEMIEYIFKDEAKKIEDYCKQELADRVSGKVLNPGNSYKIRYDLWQKFMSKDTNDEKFDYTYAERINKYKQIDKIINTLKEDIHSRRAVISIWDAGIDIDRLEGYSTRIPCSISYQFLIRNHKLLCIYYSRSNDYYAHWIIDIWLAAGIMGFITGKLIKVYPDLKVGSLNYFCGSFHAYNHDFKKRNIIF